MYPGSKTLKSLFRESVAAVRTRPFLFAFLIPLLAVCITPFIFKHDIAWSNGITAQRPEAMIQIMKKVSSLGGFGGVAALCVALWVAGKLMDRKKWMLIGTAALLAASVAGLFDNVIRASTGRPRPKTRIEKKVEDKFTGPTINSRFQSFPSAHTAVAFGAAVCVAVALPALAVPAFATAGLIAFSRIYVLAHYPADIFAAAMIGLWFGLAFGLGGRATFKKE